VQPLELPRQQRQLILSTHIELLIWHRHQKVQGEHSGGWVVLVFPFEPPIRARLWVSRALNLGYHAPIHLCRLEL
jgi:hypothetical protein